MTPDNFSTHSLIPRDQLEAWREWFEPVLDVLPRHAAGDEFTAEMRMWKLGGLAMSRTISPPVNVVRAKSNLRREPVDHWVISYCARGALGPNGGCRARSTCESAVPLVVGAGILARTDACRPGPVLSGARRLPGYRAAARWVARVDPGHASRTSAW